MSTPSMSETPLSEIKLEFDTPQFLHALFANDPKNLGYLESVLGVKAVTREGVGTRGLCGS